MPFFFPFYQRSLIGLDIQPDAIRLVQISKSRHGFMLQRAATFATPANMFAEGKINNWDLLQSFLAEIVFGLDIKNTRVALNLSIKQVRIQKLRVPAGFSSKAIEAEIYAQIERDLPGMKEALNMDYYITAETADFINLIFIVTRREYLQQYIHCVTAAGLKVKIVDVDIFALKRIVDYVLPLALGEVCAIAYVLKDSAVLIIHEAKEILLHVQWNINNAIEAAAFIKNQMQLNQTTFAQVKKLILCASRNDCVALNHALESSLTMATIFQYAIPGLTIGPLVDSHQFREVLPDYLTCCGLAIREAPVW